MKGIKSKASSSILFLLLLSGCGPQPVREQAETVSLPVLPQAAIPTTVKISAGSFIIGDQSFSGDEDERPAYRENLNSFYLSKYEITVQQYKVFAAETGKDLSAITEFTDQQPVGRVSWHDAQEYAEWLSVRTGDVWRLPTEAEWEYAARAGVNTLYQTGNKAADLCRVANIADKTLEDSGSYNGEISPCHDGYSNKASDVGQFRPNRFGLYDMHGNVWEWVSNCHTSTYPISTESATCSKRVARGGSYKSDPYYMRLSNREAVSENERSKYIGFRLVKEL